MALKGLRTFACHFSGCNKTSTRLSGIRQHFERVHKVPVDLQPTQRVEQHLPQELLSSESSENGSDFEDLPGIPETAANFWDSPPCTPEPSFPPGSSSPHRSPHHGRTPLGSPQRPYSGPCVNAAGVNIRKHDLIDGGFPIHLNHFQPNIFLC